MGSAQEPHCRPLVDLSYTGQAVDLSTSIFTHDSARPSTIPLDQPTRFVASSIVSMRRRPSQPVVTRGPEEVLVELRSRAVEGRKPQIKDLNGVHQQPAGPRDPITVSDNTMCDHQGGCG